MSKKPRRISVHGQSYSVRLVIVLSRDERGMPRECRFMREDETVDVRVHNDFLTVFANDRAFEKVN